MDYTDPADRRLRDEPTLPLSPEEAQIAANLYQSQVLAELLSLSLNLTANIQHHEKEDHDPRHN